MPNIMKDLSTFAPVDCGEYVSLTTSALFHNNFCKVTFHIYPGLKGYSIVMEDEDFFYHCNCSSGEYYYKRFTNECSCEKFGIQFMEERFYKDYPNNYNIIVAIDEFVRYFIYLDDFISTIE